MPGGSVIDAVMTILKAHCYFEEGDAVIDKVLYLDYMYIQEATLLYKPGYTTMECRVCVCIVLRIRNSSEHVLQQYAVVTVLEAPKLLWRRHCEFALCSRLKCALSQCILMLSCMCSVMCRF
jgi:hypothetical protein